MPYAFGLLFQSPLSRLERLCVNEWNKMFLQPRRRLRSCGNCEVSCNQKEKTCRQSARTAGMPAITQHSRMQPMLRLYTLLQPMERRSYRPCQKINPRDLFACKDRHGCLPKPSIAITPRSVHLPPTPDDTSRCSLTAHVIIIKNVVYKHSDAFYKYTIHSVHINLPPGLVWICSFAISDQKSPQVVYQSSKR